MFYSMVYGKNETTRDTIDNLQQLKGETKLHFHQNISNFYDKMNNGRQIKSFHFEEDPFPKNAGGTGKSFREVLLFMKFLETKPQIKNMIFFIMIYIILLLKTVVIKKM